MCRFLAVRGEPDAVHAFLQGEVPEQFQARSRRHTAGWGFAWYEGQTPELMRKPVWVRDDTTFLPALRDITPKTAILHVRRATRGVISTENTHPFTLGRWTFAHNGTIVNKVTDAARDWLKPDTAGQTDSEVFFHLLLHFIAEKGSVVEGTRAAVRWILGISKSPRLNFILSDGDRLYAYRRGHTLYHFAMLIHGKPVEGVSSDSLGEGWRTIGRDWMITLNGSPSSDKVERILLDSEGEVPPVRPLTPLSA